MSTVSPSRPRKRPKPNPYRYGWRDVCVIAPDGTETFQRVPLTLQDVLFPKTGDFIVQTDAHNSDTAYLKEVFKSRLAGHRTAAVISDCLVDWNLPGVEPLGPDIAVFFGVKQFDDWATFDVAAEGARPVLVVEVTSPKTRQNDIGPKFEFYQQARVPLYLIANASGRGRKRRLQLMGYRYTRRGYQPIKPDAQGRIVLEPLRLAVGITRDRRGGYDRLVCFDLETGEELGDYTAVVEALAAAQAEARAQAERANAEAKRAERRGEARRRRDPCPRRGRGADPRTGSSAEGVATSRIVSPRPVHGNFALMRRVVVRLISRGTLPPSRWESSRLPSGCACIMAWLRRVPTGEERPC